MSIDFNATDFDILEKAAKAIGATNIYVNVKQKVLQFTYRPEGGGQYRYTVADGQITAQQGAERGFDVLKRQYTKEVLKSASARFGLSLSEKNENQLSLKWRY